METARSHTKIKSFRFDADLILRIKMAAKKLHVNENTYVTRILTSALTIAPLSSAFIGIKLAEETFASVLSTSNADSLEIDGVALGKKNYALVRELFESVGIQMTYVKFLVEILAEEGNWFVVEGNPTESSEFLILIHKYGEKWSIFLKSYLSGAYEVVLTGKLQIDIKGNVLKVRFPKQDSKF